MTGWYAPYVMTGDLIRGWLQEAEGNRLARLAGPAGAPHTCTAGVAAAGTRRWTLRLSRLVVRISLDVAARKGAGS